MIISKQYIGDTGATYIQDALLSFVTILTVVRSGRVYTEVSGSPVNMEFKYTGSTGRVDFDTNMPFTGPDVTAAFDTPYEIIIIKYKE